MLDETDVQAQIRKKTITLLRSVLTTYGKSGVPLHLLSHEYQETCLERLSFREMGYGTLEQFLRDIPDVCSLVRSDEGYFVVKGVASKEDAHIFKLVSGQKKPKKKSYSKKPVALKVYRNASNFKRAPPLPSTSSSFLSRRPVFVFDNVFRPPHYSTAHQNKVISRNSVQQVSSYIKNEFKSENNIQSPRLSPINLTTEEIGSLERKLKDLLCKRPNGLWLTRLKPEFKTHYNEDLQFDMKAVIEKYFLNFVDIQCPAPNREILYLKKKDSERVSESENLVVNISNTSSESKRNIFLKDKSSAFTATTSVFTAKKSSSSLKTSVSTAETASSVINELVLLEISGEVVDVYISHVSSLDCFYIHLADSTIGEFDTSMQVYYTKTHLLFAKAYVGKYYAVFSTEYKMWFRAKVLSLREQKHRSPLHICHVFYVDYGNDEEVIEGELRELNDEFKSLPMQAVHCTIHKINEKLRFVSEENINIFRRLTKDKKLKMKIESKDGSVYSVSLFDEDSNNLLSRLDSSSKDSVLHKSLSTQKPSITPSSIQAKWVEVPENEDYIDVTVNSVFSSNSVSVSMIGSEYSEKLGQLENEIFDFFQSTTDSHILSLQVGKFYAAYSGSTWKRVEILEIMRNECEVLLLDYGNKVTLPTAEVKNLPERFLVLPFQSIKCSLHNVPSCFDADILQYLSDACIDSALIAHIIERPVNKDIVIELYGSNADEENINRELVSRMKSDNQQPKVPEPGCQTVGYITHITLTGDFFIQIRGPGLERLQEIMMDINSHFSQKTSGSEILSRPSIGTICCAKYMNDGLWYRAKVTQEMTEDNKFEVEFVDYGNLAVISNFHIRKPKAVSEKVVSLPFQAIKCRVIGLSEKHFDEFEKINDFVKDLDYVMIETVQLSELPLVRILVPDGDNDLLDFVDWSIKMLTAEDEKTLIGESVISSQMDALNLNQKIDIKTELDQILNMIPNMQQNIFEGYVQAAENPYKFLVIPTSRWNDYKDMLINLLTLYENQKVEEGLQFKVGDLCAVYRSEDELWHRGIIKSTKMCQNFQNEEFVVCFPDVSLNMQITSKKDIRLLETQFKKVPFFAIECSLGDIEPISSEWWCKKTSEYFIDSVVFNSFQVEILSRDLNTLNVLLHGASENNKHYTVNQNLVLSGLARYKT